MASAVVKSQHAESVGLTWVSKPARLLSNEFVAGI